MLVERVERRRREDQREAEERGGGEADAEIRERTGRREATGQERPPEHEAGADEDRVLDVQRPAGAERPVEQPRGLLQIAVAHQNGVDLEWGKTRGCGGSDPGQHVR